MKKSFAGWLCVAAIVCSFAIPGVAFAQLVPAEIKVAIDDVAWTNLINGDIVVTGELTCSQPVEDLDFYVEVEQKQGDKNVYAWGEKYSVDCEDRILWDVYADSSAGIKPGLAGAQVTVDSSNADQAENSTTVDAKGCTIIGTPESEEIKGTLRKDTICGLQGHDVIYGLAGNDTVRSYDGQDTIYGGTGDDFVLAGFGNDTLYGGAGDDYLDGDEQHDYIDGGAGKDECLGGTGSNRFRSCEKKTKG